MEKTTEEYLAGIRRTIAESKRMMESVKLRFAETDRLLEENGMTREEVMKMRFSPEQKAAVNEELKRRGMAPLEDYDVESDRENARAAASPMIGAAEIHEDLENRKRKFGTMMKRFRM